MNGAEWKVLADFTEVILLHSCTNEYRFSFSDNKRKAKLVSTQMNQKMKVELCTGLAEVQTTV